MLKIRSAKFITSLPCARAHTSRVRTNFHRARTHLRYYMYVNDNQRTFYNIFLNWFFSKPTNRFSHLSGSFWEPTRQRKRSIAALLLGDATNLPVADACNEKVECKIAASTERWFSKRCEDQSDRFNTLYSTNGTADNKRNVSWEVIMTQTMTQQRCPWSSKFCCIWYWIIPRSRGFYALLYLDLTILYVHFHRKACGNILSIFTWWFSTCSSFIHSVNRYSKGEPNLTIFVNGWRRVSILRSVPQQHYNGFTTWDLVMATSVKS